MVSGVLLGRTGYETNTRILPKQILPGPGTHRLGCNYATPLGAMHGHSYMGRTKFTTSDAHDVIAITSPQKNDLCTEELRDRARHEVASFPGSCVGAQEPGNEASHEVAKSLDEVSLPLIEQLDSVVLIFR